jgi:hypothetical protein
VRVVVAPPRKRTAGGDLPLLDEGDIFDQEPEHAFA